MGSLTVLKIRYVISLSISEHTLGIVPSLVSLLHSNTALLARITTSETFLISIPVLRKVL